MLEDFVDSSIRFPNNTLHVKVLRNFWKENPKYTIGTKHVVLSYINKEEYRMYYIKDYGWIGGKNLFKEIKKC
jgi:hypothetical protein